MPNTAIPVRRIGWADALLDARLEWLRGGRYPAPPAALYLALTAGVAVSDGSGETRELTPRVRVSYGRPHHSGDQLGGHPHQRQAVPDGPVAFVPFGPPGTFAGGNGWALFGQPSGGAPLYAGVYAWRLLCDQPTTLPASTFPVLSESI